VQLAAQHLDHGVLHILALLPANSFSNHARTHKDW
jgi:hypothetical protein